MRQYFISEEEAVAIIDANMHEIEAKMASGSNANASQYDGNYPYDDPDNTRPDLGRPCNGPCNVPGDPGACCDCCRC